MWVDSVPVAGVIGGVVVCCHSRRNVVLGVLLRIFLVSGHRGVDGDVNKSN